MTGIQKLIDRLGLVKAQIALLIEKEQKIKAELISRTGVRKPYDKVSKSGILYDATITAYFREVLDLDAVRAKLSKQYIAAHTTKVPVIRVEVQARKRDQRPVKPRGHGGHEYKKDV